MNSQKKIKPTRMSNVSPAKENPDTKSDKWGNQWHKCLPLSEKEFQEVEKQLQISIPSELKTLFLSCNGGRPEKSYFTNGHIEVEIGSLLPIRPPTSYKGKSLEKIHEWLLSRGYPSELLPFAYDTGNSGIFCLDTSTGEVTYWVQDESGGSIKKVALSLTDFLSTLTRPPY